MIATEVVAEIVAKVLVAIEVVAVVKVVATVEIAAETLTVVEVIAAVVLIQMTRTAKARLTIETAETLITAERLAVERIT